MSESDTQCIICYNDFVDNNCQCEICLVAEAHDNDENCNCEGICKKCLKYMKDWDDTEDYYYYQVKIHDGLKFNNLYQCGTCKHLICRSCHEELKNDNEDSFTFLEIGDIQQRIEIGENGSHGGEYYIFAKPSMRCPYCRTFSYKNYFTDNCLEVINRLYMIDYGWWHHFSERDYKRLSKFKNYFENNLAEFLDD